MEKIPWKLRTSRFRYHFRDVHHFFVLIPLISTVFMRKYSCIEYFPSKRFFPRSKNKCDRLFGAAIDTTQSKLFPHNTI